MCGGTRRRRQAFRRTRGLSPRVRGNLPPETSAAGTAGSIPACAGEPHPALCRCDAARVYPRVCGGTQPGTRSGGGMGGLSPRVRGNRTQNLRIRPAGRSIPACAGEPQHQHGRQQYDGVYPRVCGGTAGHRRPPAERPGLSPRVRGNPTWYAFRRRDGGSIPACAGEPRRRRDGQPGTRVYPRVCGGTTGICAKGVIVPGLSPRVRGNRVLYAFRRRDGGSIPACAGEPGPSGVRRPRCKVYPRVCGGTPHPAAGTRTRLGLSPRVRGNPADPAGAGRIGRSIPACAGEPRLGIPGQRSTGVYPRVCGGTERAA